MSWLFLGEIPTVAVLLGGAVGFVRGGRQPARRRPTGAVGSVT